MSSINVLIVEDNSSDVELLRRALLKRDTSYFTDITFNLVYADCLSEARLALSALAADVILLDLALPDSYGMSALTTLRQVAPRVPIVIMTGIPDESMALQVIELGAQDYVFKGELKRHQLVRSIFYAIERQRKDEALRESELRFRTSVENMLEGFAIFAAIRDASGRITDFRYEFVNEAGCKLNRTTQEALLGRTLLEVFPNHQPTGLFDAYVRVTETGTPLVQDQLTYEDVWANQRLQRVFDLRAVRLMDGFAVTWRDVTDQKKAAEALSVHAAQMSALYQTSLEMNAQLDLNSLLRSIVERAVILTQTSVGGLYLCRPQEQSIELVVDYHLPGNYLGAKLAFGEGLSGKVAQTGKLLYAEDYQAWEGQAGPFKDTRFKRVLGIPLNVHRKTMGVITLSDTSYSGPFSKDQIQLASLFADQAAIALENAQLYQEIQQLAITDELTRLTNRRGLLQLGTREVERSLRFGYPLTAIVLDIDHFKEVNDRYGHETGDRVLKGLAGRMRESVGELDILARYGGDEFVILLLENTISGAVSFGERLKEMIAQNPFSTRRGDLPVTVSIGVAEVGKTTRDLAMLLDQADQALYRAKQAGRNRVSQ